MADLDILEEESIYIFREVLSNFSRPLLLYSIGKDSSVMLHLAKKAFAPCKLPFPLLHIDTTWKFQEMIEFRDKIAKNYNVLTYTNIDGINDNLNPFTSGPSYTDVMKTQALKKFLHEYKCDVAIGGARRDEEASRAKEKIFSFRNAQQGWDPKLQSIEFKDLYNCLLSNEESFRVFPLSNWTEKDIWRYIKRENIEIVPLYFAKERPVVKYNNQLIIADDARIFQYLPDAEINIMKVRCRTLGCYPLTGVFPSNADTIDKIIDELESTNTSERVTRMIDTEASFSMERRKREGYF